jgi:alpha-beta hydrolase superfamily lysophospholipase
MAFTIGEWTPQQVEHDNESPLRYGYWINPETSAGKPVVVFWPGLGGSVKNALGFFNQLLPYTQAIFVPDLRGFGLNEGHACPSSPKVQVRDGVQFVRQVAMPFAKKHAADHDEAWACPIVFGGISLGALIQMAVADQWQSTPDDQPIRGQFWVAPACKPSSVSFKPSQYIKSLGGLIKERVGDTQCNVQTAPAPKGMLPYGLSALTRHPQVLNEALHQARVDEFRISYQYLLGIRQLSHENHQKISRNPLATWVCVPGRDTVCSPDAMIAEFTALPYHPNHQAVLLPSSFHDVLVEPEMPMVAKKIGSWLKLTTSPPNFG